MTDQSPHHKRDFDALAKRVGFALSIAAFALSVFNFAHDHLVAQHVLRAAVVAIDGRGDSTAVRILLVNEGKHDETLYSARLLFNGKTYGRSVLGPRVLKSGEAHVDSLVEVIDVASLREDGTVPPGSDRLGVAVEFTPVTRVGAIREDGLVYGFTHWWLAGNAVVGASPHPTDKKGLVDLDL